MKSGDVLQFEVMLHRLGVLLVLEEGQVVEAIEQPNPFHPVQETDLHQQWWAEHRRDEEEFSKQFGATRNGPNLPLCWCGSWLLVTRSAFPLSGGNLS
jgi:hypothetical protein